MLLSAEQQRLIRNRIAADGPFRASAFSLWLFLGLLGGHRFYLERNVSGAAMAALFVLSGSLAACGIIFGGTPLDGLFYQPDITDILRASASRRGANLFCGGAALFALLSLWWLYDGFALPRFIRALQAEKQQALTEFFRSY